MINDAFFIQKHKQFSVFQSIFAKNRQGKTIDFQAVQYSDGNPEKNRNQKIITTYSLTYFSQIHINRRKMQNLKPFEEKFCKLDKIVINEQCKQGHFQLSQELKFLSQQHFIFYFKNTINICCFPTFMSQKIYTHPCDIYTIDYQRQNNIVSIVDDKFEVFLLDLNTKQKIGLSHFYPINNIVGRAVFHKQDDSKISISGNAKYLSKVDINKMKYTEIKSQHFINNHCYSDDENFISYCLDDKITEIKDIRSNESQLINVDSLYQLASCFLTDNLLAVSYIERHERGPSFIKFFDLRNTQKEIQKIEIFSVSKQLLYLRQKNLLLSGGMQVGLEFIKLNPILERDTFSLMGNVGDIGYEKNTGKIVTGFEEVLQASIQKVVVINQKNYKDNGKDQQHYNL